VAARQMLPGRYCRHLHALHVRFPSKMAAMVSRPDEEGAPVDAVADKKKDILDCIFERGAANIY
jgi:hypothetical protein